MELFPDRRRLKSVSHSILKEQFLGYLSRKWIIKKGRGASVKDARAVNCDAALRDTCSSVHIL
jgi:hypothetical protein